MRQESESAQYWRNVHLKGDKSPPINLPDRRVRRSIGTATMLRRSGKDAGVIYE
ncbi:hypothetical protein [Sphingobium fluviale]|uniref:hypothetical protein n=1 Tax=Sphingobium fluviale TaxID=2506423 RepID=UPI0013E9953E|nr:hypothetical protein [Sphingobium fluviale]